ncbi:flagellar filament capping protein FliD [Litoribrevibacter euphylliae]|uniref:Flagellar hook-associated protein 2 n=1 Tax=Litoribrevibacter euphylliae TaxID=1834034 RepID=A0ABV7HF74_9GAMM
MGITSVGIGSGFLTSDLIDQLVDVERSATEPRLDANQEKLETQLSEVGRIKSAIEDFRLQSRILTIDGALTSTQGSSSSSAISVSTEKGAVVGSYSMSVEQLAQSQSVVSSSFAAKDTALSNGVLTIEFGTFTFGDTNATPGDAPDGGDNEDITGFTDDASSDPISIIVTDDNNTLEGIRDAINEKDAGITASILNDGSGYRLVLKSDETGETSAFRMTVSGDSDGDSSDANGLSALSFNATNQHMTESVRAQDAELTFNGISVTRSTNEVEELIDGVTFELSDTTTSSTITVSRDEDLIVERLQNFTDAYNELQSIIKEVTAYDSETGQGAVLLGDSTVRSLSMQLRGNLTQIVPGLEDANVRSLAEIGFKTDYKTGQIEFDSEEFLDQLEEYPDEVADIFGRNLISDNDDVTFASIGSKTEPGEYDVVVTQLATQGALSGSVVGTPTNILIDGTNDELVLEVDGVTSGTLTLTNNTYATLADLAAEIQTQIDADSALSDIGVTVTVDSDTLIFTSEKFGSSSSVNLTSVEDGSAYGLSVGNGTDGVDVEGTINGQPATGSGQRLSLSLEDDPADGVSVDITATSFPGASTQLTSTITVADGVAQSMVESFNDMLSFEGLISNKIFSLNEQLNAVDQQRIDLDERLESFQERLTRQFIAADTRVSQLNNTEQFVKTQLAAIVSSFTGGGDD